MVNTSTSNRILKFTLSVAAVIVMMIAFAVGSSAASYSKIVYDVPRISQRPNTGDCAIASMSTIEAYFHGLPAGDYNSKAYQSVYSANGNTISANWSKIGYKKVDGFDMKTAYDQLKTGYPVIIYRSSSHYSVIYGYDGNTSSLEMSGFLVVDVDDSYNSTTAYQRLDSWKRSYSLTRMVLRMDGLAISSDSLKINGNHPADAYTKGEKFTPYGMVISNKNITNVSVSVKSSTGNPIQTFSATPNATSYGLSNASGKIDCSTLAEGNYSYVISAKDSSGATKNVTYNFKVTKDGTGGTGGSTTDTTIKTVSYKAVVKADPSLNLRLSAGTDGAVLTTIPKGEVVDVTAECNGWALVSYNKYVGWVSMKYIEKYTESKTDDVDISGTDGPIRYARIKKKTSLKSSKFLFASNVTDVSANLIVPIISSENGWLKVRYNGKDGYISASICVVGVFDVDFNNAINSADALLILEQSIGKTKFNSTTLAVADINGDNIANSADALEVLKVATGDKKY